MKRTFISVAISLAASISLTQAAGPHHADWGYTGATGPAHWGQLDHAYLMCGLGKNQSPVDIHNVVDAKLPSLAFSYKEAGKEFFNNGHTVEVSFEGKDQLEIDGKKFKLLQFHFHTPSENTVEGKHYPMEAHLVHQSKDGQLAVVAIFFKKGAKNPALEKLVATMPSKDGEKIELKKKILASDLLPKDLAYYRFNGSLTTPPCSEGVRWIVLKTPVEVSSEQIDAFSKVLKKNNRPTQPIDARLIVE